MMKMSYIRIICLLSGASLALQAAIVAAHTKQQRQSSPLHHLRYLASPSEEEKARQYHIWPSQEIHETLRRWADEYPDLVRLTTAQFEYGLPRPGGPKDCPFDEGGDGCLNFILTIQDFVVHPEGSDSSNRLPEVLWSGCVHGNERVGPTATMEAVSLLLQAATCEAKPNKQAVKTHVGHAIHEDEGTTWNNELESAKSCRDALKMTTAERQWLARLVATRRIVVVPTANVLGYSQSVREEAGIDPNRDFPFDVQDPALCMQTVAGRTLNEVFREHMFQLSLTFHGGMEVVAYEWGAPTYLHKNSPDELAQSEIAAAYSNYAAGFQYTKPYKYGTMNDLVYYVRGGMEDWAYAGSWDPDRVIECQPTQYGGYPAEKTRYNNSTLRVFNMLVETSNHKIPTQNTLGTSLDVLDRTTTGNGHISRNIRLALLAADLVQPYVDIIGVNDLQISDNVVPLMTRSDRGTCQKIKQVMIPQNAQEVTVEWTVGGGMTIDETSLWYGKWQDVPEDVISCMSQPPQDVSTFLTKVTPDTAASGTGFFSRNGAHPPPSNTALNRGPTFRATLDVSNYNKNDLLVVVARARLDGSWMQQPNGNVGPPMPPQAHVVNARNNPDWHHESAGKIIQGRLDWYTTIPLTIFVGDFSDSVGSQGGRDVSTIEISNRFGHTTGGTKGGMAPSQGSRSDESLLTWKHLVGLTVSLIVVASVSIVCRRYRQNARHQRITNELMEEAETGFDGVQPYSDRVDSMDSEDDDDGLDFGTDDGLGNGDAGDLELQKYSID